MRPAFSSPAQTAAFALLVGALIALPAVVGGTGWLKRSEIYAELPLAAGSYPWIRHQLFEETNDVDMVFLGSSHMGAGIHAPYVQKQLSDQIGRPAVVFVLPWCFRGYDTLYLVSEDLLARRRVKTLVVYDEWNVKPHPIYHRLFPEETGAQVTPSLGRLERLGNYGGLVLSMPRHLLSLARPNPTTWRTNEVLGRWDMLDPAEHLGSVRLRGELGKTHGGFRPYSAPTPASPSVTQAYSRTGQNGFSLKPFPSDNYTRHFTGKLRRLCQQHGTKLVVLHLPEWDERTSATMAERDDWEQLLGPQVPLIGVPCAQLFAGIPSTELPRFFYDRWHLNQNGQDLFTPRITPLLLKLHGSATNTF